jgi:hypothetical protein
MNLSPREYHEYVQVAAYYIWISWQRAGSRGDLYNWLEAEGQIEREFGPAPEGFE